MDPYDRIFECCSNDGGPDFSKLTWFKRDFEEPTMEGGGLLSATDLSDWNFWGAAAFICFMSALHCLAVSLQRLLQLDCECDDIGLPTRWTNWDSTVLEYIFFFLGCGKVLQFRVAVLSQPSWERLEDQHWQVTGYIFLSIGCCLIFSCVCRFGLWNTFGRRDGCQTHQSCAPGGSCIPSPQTSRRSASPARPTRASTRSSSSSPQKLLRNRRCSPARAPGGPRRSGSWSPQKLRRNRSVGCSPATIPQSSPVPRKFKDLYTVFHLGSVAVFLGYSCLCGSQAGLLLTAAQAITYCYGNLF